MDMLVPPPSQLGPAAAEESESGAGSHPGSDQAVWPVSVFQ